MHAVLEPKNTQCRETTSNLIRCWWVAAVSHAYQFLLLCWWPIFLSWVYEHVHIYLHLYLNSVIFSIQNSVNIMLISVAVSRHSLHCQWKQILILCAATAGKFVGLSRPLRFSDVPVPPEPFSNCPNHIVENHLLGPWESTQWLRATMDISTPEKYFGSRNPCGDIEIHIIFWQTFWHIVCLLFWRLFWLGYLPSIR